MGGLRSARRAWFWPAVSILVGALVLTVGLAPFPLNWIVGPPLVAGLIALGIPADRRWRNAGRNGRAVAVPVTLCVVGLTLALLFRGSDPAVFVVPALAVAVPGACRVWSRRRPEAPSSAP